jgi:hypothetical protein
MKVAFVFPPMWTPHSDGSLQIWNREITTRLKRLGTVLVYSGRFNLARDEFIDGLQYRRLSTVADGRFLKCIERVFKLLKIRRPLFATDIWYIFYALKVAIDLRKRSCDLVHVYNYPHFATLIRRFNPELKVVLNMHGEWLTQLPFANLSYRLRQLDLIVGCSDLISKSIAHSFPEIADRCKTVPMGISSESL